jgi:hypothetical protein
MLSLRYSLLLLLSCLPVALAVCATCSGNACNGSGACPWSSTVAANVQAIATGAAITVAALLPAKILRLFPRPVLEAISALSVRTLEVFDPSGKTISEILAAVKHGRLTREDAVAHMAERGTAVDASQDTAAPQLRQIEFAVKALEATKGTLSNTSSSAEGALLFVLFKLSSAFCGKSSTAVCLDCDTSDGTPGSSTSSHKSFSAQLVRPTSEASMSSLLNMFIAVSHSTGLANVLALTVFLEDVVYEPLRAGVIVWPVAFECMIIYLRMLESQTGATYNLSTIYHAAGGIDAVRAEATRAAHLLYPAAFFRSHGGNPSFRPDVDPNPGNAVYSGKVVADTSTSKMGCVAWNRGSDHLAKHVHPNGTCKFRHACNVWVTDKGPRGQCLGNHKADKCDYDPSKRSKDPVKA